MTDTGTATQVLRDLYGIDADLTRLYGELDDNFLAVTPAGEKTVLKIMHVGCDAQRVDLQCEAMKHLADLALNLPQVIPTTSGQAYAECDVEGIERLVWSLKYCPGILLEEVTPQTDELIRSFGRTMARLDVGLDAFTHPAMKQGHKWELTRAGATRPFVRYIAGDAAARVDEALGRFDSVIHEKLEHLPHSVIHNDANSGNVLVNVKVDGRAVVDGLIDFGDITYEPTVCEAAIALAYVVIDKEDPLRACTQFLGAYSELHALDSDEISVLFDLISTRLAVSIAIAAERSHVDPEDQLGSQDKEPAIRALSRLAVISPEDAENCFHQACSRSPI
jgi:Ser/Thr protein kinase RdoA (MazF antagonist)